MVYFGIKLNNAKLLSFEFYPSIDIDIYDFPMGGLAISKCGGDPFVISAT